MYQILAEFIVRQRRGLLILSASLFAICAVLAVQIEFNFTPQQLFESSGDDHEYREIFAERFGREDNLVTILIEGEDLFIPEVLGPLRDLTYELRQLPDIVDAQSVATLAMPRAESLSAEPILLDFVRASDEEVLPRPLRGPPVLLEEAQSLREYSLSEPLIVNRLISRGGNQGLVVAWVDPEIQEIAELKRATDAVYRALRAYEFPAGVNVEVRGIPPLRVEIVDTLRGEQLFFIPITALVFLLILLILFRSASGVVLPLGTVALSLLATLALLVVTGSSINIINNVLPTLIFVIGISDSIHMLTRQAEEVDAGRSHQEGVKAMVRHTGAACLLTTGTTAVGFLSLLAADTAILRQFGWQAAAGVMFAYLFTLFFLSAGLTYLRPAKRITTPSSQGRAELPRLERGLMAVGRLVLSRPWTVLTVSLLVSGVVIVQGSKVVVDTTILEIFGDEHPTAQATRRIEAGLGGVLPMEISLEADDFDRFKDPEIYGAIAELQAFAREQEIVLSSESYVDFLQTARVALIGDPGERENLPTNRDQIEQLLLLFSDAPDSRSGIGTYVTGDFRHARVLLRVEDAGANAALLLARNLEEEIEEIFSPFPDLRIRITGDAYVASAALSSFVRDLLFSLFLAVFVIFLLMTVVFRSLKIGVISLLPNSLPLLITFGYMGFAGIPLNTTTIIIFAISLGIAVDDAIHFFARFVEERDRTENLEEAILQTYYGAGRAILLTSLLLVIGLSVLTFSEFIPTRQFGILTGITIVGAVIADLLLLPAILYLVYSRFPGAPRRAPLQPPPTSSSV